MQHIQITLVCIVILRKTKGINYSYYIDRYDTNAVTRKRTSDTICEHARSGAYGVIHQPLIKIDIDKGLNCRYRKKRI